MQDSYNVLCGLFCVVELFAEDLRRNIFARRTTQNVVTPSYAVLTRSSTEFLKTLPPDSSFIQLGKTIPPPMHRGEQETYIKVYVNWGV